MIQLFQKINCTFQTVWNDDSQLCCKSFFPLTARIAPLQCRSPAWQHILRRHLRHLLPASRIKFDTWSSNIGGPKQKHTYTKVDTWNNRYYYCGWGHQENKAYTFQQSCSIVMWTIGLNYPDWSRCGLSKRVRVDRWWRDRWLICSWLQEWIP